MTSPEWVPIAAVVIIHDRQISRHGGSSGLRDRGLLEAGCARPLNKHGFGVTDLFELATAYAFGISKAHAFVDGNKRTAFVTCATFLRLNGFEIIPDPIEGVRVVEDLARDAMSEVEFAEWLQAGATSP